MHPCRFLASFGASRPAKPRRPDISMNICAVAGNAVFFAYETPNASGRTLHGSAPVGDGEKWVAVKWFRQGPFE
jgi:prolyl 4-hydroxylase